MLFVGWGGEAAPGAVPSALPADGVEEAVFSSLPPACPIGTNTWAMGAKAAHASEAGALVLHEPSSAHISEVFRNVALVPAGLWWAEGGMQPLVERGN